MITDPDEVVPADAEAPRMHVFGEVFQQVLEGDLEPETRKDAALWLRAQAKEFEGFHDVDTSHLDAEGQELVAQTAHAIDVILGNRQFQDVIAEAEQVSAKDFGDIPVISEANVNSPEVRNTYSRMAQIAQSNPAGVDPEFVTGLLNQRNAGNIEIPEARAKALEAAAGAARDAQSAEQAKAALGQKAKTRDIVREEILSGGKNSEAGQWGLSRHQAEIISHLAQGRDEEAQLQMERLGNFVEHMHNKARAAGESLSLGRTSNNEIPYRTWTGTEWVSASNPRANTVYVAPSENSLRTGREIAIDAQTATDLYNRLLSIYSGQLMGDRVRGGGHPPRSETCPADPRRLSDAGDCSCG